ncbi:hypothetical protein CYG49_00120 [Candidatus Saccharibacteria bacterium]|nr:MAG: hypothetical protein CYG49_00120 [Candidatus Saccharibacteria bacterium]
MKENLKKLLKSKIFLALTLSIVVALGLTSLSVYMYVSSGVSKLDLSLPQYEQIRKEVEPNTPNDEFETTGPINQDVINEFMKLYEKEQKQLQSNSAFDNTNLEDDALRLTPETQATPPTQ